jgi:hypothetical protein
MGLAPVFHATVTDTDAPKPVVIDKERELWREYLRTLRGKDVELVVRKVRVRRSLDQNAYLHRQPFRLLADYVGDSIEGVKLSLMGECWGWKRCPITGRDIPVQPNTSDMSVEECTEFIDWLIPWALEHYPEVRIPLPGQAEG